MTLVQPERRRTPRAATKQDLEEDQLLIGLDLLRFQIDRSVIEATGGEEDAFLSQVIADAVDSFATCRGDVRAAATRLAPTMRRLGERQALRGYDDADLVAAFRAARVSAQKQLQLALGSSLAGRLLVRLREDLMAYLAMLCAEVRAGLDQTRTLMALTPDERMARIASAVFDRAPVPGLLNLVQLAGIEPADRFVAVVATSGSLPASLLRHPRGISRTSTEVLLPVGPGLAGLLDGLETQVVTGPPATLTESTDALLLARRAATMLNRGTVTDVRMVVPCMDLISELVMDSNPLLAAMIEHKHLAELEAVPVPRRVSLGEVCLRWLERGVPTNQLARSLGIAPQTVHNRMQTLRTMFGDALDDPNLRLELIVALRAALPRWRSEL